MGAFAATGTVTTSQDGKTLTFNDTSPYGNNDAGLVLANFTSRTVIVYDANQNVLGTIDLGPTSLTGNWPITQDGVYVFQPTLVSNEPHTYIGTVDFPAIQLYNLAQINYSKTIKCNSCCAADAADYANMAQECIYSAGNNIQVGDLISAQSDIEKATIFINKAQP